MNKGQLFIISGPSGSGKDTLLKKLFQKCKDIEFSISTVTRAMRDGEIQGEKYNFISVKEFNKLIAEDDLLEYNEYCGNYYGTPKQPVFDAIENGRDIILEIDVNGAKKIRQTISEAISVFIIPPSIDELYRRLSKRGTEKSDIIEERMKQAIQEIEQALNYDYIIVNDNLDEAVNILQNIIKCERCKTSRNKNIIKEVLGNVRSINR